MDTVIQTKLIADRAVELLTANGYPMTKNTLRKLGQQGKGPPRVRWGNRNIYDPGALLAWAESRGKMVAV